MNKNNVIVNTKLTVADLIDAVEYMRDEDAEITVTQDMCDALAHRINDAIQDVIVDFVEETW